MPHETKLYNIYRNFIGQIELLPEYFHVYKVYMDIYLPIMYLNVITIKSQIKLKHTIS